MGEFQSLGLSISLFKPDIAFTAGSPNTVVITPEGQFVEAIASQVADYGHILRAFGGYHSASFSINVNQPDLERWYQDGLGMHVEVKDEAATTVFEGFVAQLSISEGPLSIVRGSLIDAGNRVDVAYSKILDVDMIPPSSGERKRTDVGENDASQRKYGVLPLQLSCGDATDVGAAQIRDRWLAEHALPERTESLTLEGAATPAVRFNCLGYNARLGWPYRQIAVSDEGNISTKIAAVLDADVNGLFSSANAEIVANTLQVPLYEDSDRDAWSILKSLTAAGDAAFNRYILGVWADRRVKYAAIPTEVEYNQYVTSERQSISYVDGREIKPWNVLPGKWLRKPDFLTGYTFEGTDLRDDPRTLFIESVSYSAPWGLTLQGGQTDTISQVLSQQGLRGAVA